MCICGDINTTTTSDAALLVAPPMNNCHTCFSKIILASLALSGIPLLSVEDSRIGFSAHKSTITWPFIAFCGIMHVIVDNSKAQFASILVNDHGFIMCNHNGLNLEIMWIFWPIRKCGIF